MAFHLHRLGLVGRALREAGYNKNDAADIAAGRLSLNSAGAGALAERLGVAVQQITRALSDDEWRAWSFYRRAAADPQHVWQRAQEIWRNAKLTDQAAAKIMGLKKSNIATALSTPQRRLLTFQQAARLTTALNVVEGPESLLPSPKNNDTPRQRR